MKRENQGRTIQSVKITINILTVLQENGRTGVTELAEELGHSKSTIHSHLATLEAEEMIVRDNGGYRISLGILDLSTSVRQQIGNYGVIKEEVNNLAEQTGEIAQFGVEEFGQVAYLYKQSGSQAVNTASRPGTYQPMFSTSLGKAILAFLSSERTKEIIQSTEFEALTPQTITIRGELYNELEQIQDRGYATDDEENIQGVRCVAAPVKNNETVLGAISITGPSSRFTNERLHSEFSDLVKNAANIIELNTKFS